MNHNCPACGEPTISSWRKFVAETVLPVRCQGCGSIVRITGMAWNISSIISDILLIFGVSFALVTAINYPLYGAALFIGFVLSWILLRMILIRVGQISVAVDNRFRDFSRKATLGDPRRSFLASVIWCGLISSVVRGAWVTSFFGLAVAVFNKNNALIGLCLVVIVFSGAAMRRLSPAVERMHPCPGCGKSTISSWEKLYPPLIGRPKCSECGSEYITSAGILDWNITFIYLLLHIVPFAAFFLKSFIPVILLGAYVSASMAFAINFVPVIEHKKKQKGNKSAAPSQ
jgi:transcription elongation factor Elf1